MRLTGINLRIVFCPEGAVATAVGYLESEDGRSVLGARKVEAGATAHEAAARVLAKVNSFEYLNDSEAPPY
jgi:hypothetical protein